MKKTGYSLLKVLDRPCNLQKKLQGLFIFLGKGTYSFYNYVILSEYIA